MRTKLGQLYGENYSKQVKLTYSLRAQPFALRAIFSSEVVPPQAKNGSVEAPWKAHVEASGPT